MAKNSKIPGWPDMLQPPFANLAAGFGQGATNAGVPSGLAGGMDFMKGLWGGMPPSVPGFVLPTLDIGELDKKIEDLRSVESWLALNANMLKATIQGLEVQRNTLAALQALREKGDFLGSMMRPAAGSAASAQPSAAEFESSKAPPSPEQSKSKAAFAESFRQSFGAGAGNPNWPLPLEPGEAVQQVEADEPPPYVAPQKAKKSERKKGHKARAKQFAVPAVPSSSSTAQSANLWMNFLKDQFGQIASAALLTPPPAGTAKASVLAAKAAVKRPAKRAARAASTKRAKAPVRSRSGPAAKAATRRQPTGAKG